MEQLVEAIRSIRPYLFAYIVQATLYVKIPFDIPIAKFENSETLATAIMSNKRHIQAER